MTTYDNTNRWILKRNERRAKDTSPEFVGTINIDGKEYWLSGWVKERQLGGKMFSGTVKPKEPITIGPDSPPSGGRLGSLKDQLDDEAPF